MESDLFRIALLGGLLPGLIVGVGLLLLWGLLRGEDRENRIDSHRRLRWGAPVLFGLGFLATAGAVGTLDSSLWPTNVVNRALAIGGIALACALLDALSPVRAIAWAARGAGGAAASWVVVSALHPHALNTADVALWCTLAGLGAALATWMMESPASQRAWVAPAQGVVIAQGILGLVYWSGLAGSAPQIGGVVAMLVAASVGAGLLGRVSLARGGWAFVCVLLVAYIALARVLGSGAVPVLAFALVLGGVPAGTLGRLASRRIDRPLVGALVALTITALPVAGGAWIGWRAYDAPEDDFVDWSGDSDDDGVYYTDDE